MKKMIILILIFIAVSACVETPEKGNVAGAVDKVMQETFGLKGECKDNMMYLNDRPFIYRDVCIEELSKKMTPSEAEKMEAPFPKPVPNEKNTYSFRCGPLYMECVIDEALMPDNSPVADDATISDDDADAGDINSFDDDHSVENSDM